MTRLARSGAKTIAVHHEGIARAAYSFAGEGRTLFSRERHDASGRRAASGHRTAEIVLAVHARRHSERHC